MRWNYICVTLSEDRFVDSKRFQELFFVPRAYFSCFVIVELKRGGWLLTFQNSIIVKYNIYGLLSFEWLTLEYSIDDYLRLQCYAICLMAFDKTVWPFSMMFLPSTHFFWFKLFLTFTNDGKRETCIVYAFTSIGGKNNDVIRYVNKLSHLLDWETWKYQPKIYQNWHECRCLRRTKFAWQEQNTVSELQIFYCIKN